jgi:hypothetical protein
MSGERYTKIWETYTGIGDINNIGDIHKYEIHTPIWEISINKGEIHKYKRHTII